MIKQHRKNGNGLLALLPALLILVLGLMPGSAFSQGNPPPPACPQGLLERIQQTYLSLSGFQGHFTQEDTQYDDTTVKAEGEIAYRKPGQMRWLYHPPHEQLLVTDGDTVWLHDPILDNVTIQPLQGLTQGTPLAFLLGAGDLMKDFSCRAHTRTAPEDGLIYLELLPRKVIPTLTFLQLGVRPSDARIMALIMVDKRNKARKVTFSQLQVTADFPEDYFTFEITDEMEVIRRDDR